MIKVKISLMQKIAFDGEYDLLPILLKKDWTIGERTVLKHVNEYMQMGCEDTSIEMLKILLMAVLYEDSQ